MSPSSSPKPINQRKFPRLLLLAAATIAYTLLASSTAEAAPGDALDRIDFGNVTSEAVHHFEPGVALANLPLQTTGAYNLTARTPVGNLDGSATGSQALIFTLGCDPARQNYMTVKLWGNDATALMTFYNAGYENMQDGGSPAIYPNRFYYYTMAIPIAWTTGKTSVQLTIYQGLSIGVAGQPVYSAFTHTAPGFVPDSGDIVGTAPTRTGQATLVALTAAKALGTTTTPGILLAMRQSIYSPGKYYDTLLARQVLATSAGAPVETVGLDLYTAVSTWGGASKTPDVWRDTTGGGSHGGGYSTCPDELLTMLYTTYLLPPFTDQNGATVSGLDHYHDASLLARLVSCLDGCSYEQAVDGDYNNNAGTDSNGINGTGCWKGVCSTARASGHAWAGTTARNGAWTNSLEGVDTQALGFAILNTLNDPAMPTGTGTGSPSNFLDYLGQSYDADLSGGSILRASAYERMLYRHIQYCRGTTGGTVSQNMFMELGMYAAQLALTRLQTVNGGQFYNSAYDPAVTPFTATTYVASSLGGLDIVKMVMGLLPDTLQGPTYSVSGTQVNYSLTKKGLGEAEGALSCGFDGGGYGQILPWLAPRFAQLAAVDPAASAADRTAIATQAHATIAAMNQIISPMDNVTVTNGAVTADTFVMAEEPFITYRDTKDISVNSTRFNMNTQFPASDPTGPLADAQAQRSAYLNTQYNLIPSFTTSAGNGQPGGALDFVRDLPSYEATIRGLIGVSPASMAILPAEPGAPDFAWADVQAGAAAFINNGERFYVNANWRNSLGSVSQIARIHHTTSTVERAAQIVLPYNTANVQPDGNLSDNAIFGSYCVRYGDYLIAFNNSAAARNYNLPAGYGQAKDLISGGFYTLGTTVPVPAGHCAIFWLAASSSMATGTGAPSVVTPAYASAGTITGTTVNLNVLGADDGGESSLTYTWAISGASAGPVSFSANGTNGAKSTTATFAAPGAYNFLVLIKDAGGLTTSSSLKVTVNQALTSAALAPASVNVVNGGTQQFTGFAYDQFGLPMQTPQNFTWSLPSGIGALNALGFYTVPANSSGTATVQMNVGSLSATASVTVLPTVGAFTGSLDIGSPAIAGSGKYSTGVYTVAGSGTGISSASDQFRFTGQTLTGDGTITARVVSETKTVTSAKAGVMFRNTLDANSAYALAAVAPTTANGFSFQCRATAGASAYVVGTTGGVAAPYWVRMTRSGSVFTAYSSPDGVTWTQLGSTQSLTMNGTVYVGLAVTSANASKLDTATFDNVAVTQPTHALLSSDLNIATSAPGTYSESGTTATLTAQGGDIYDTADSFHFAYTGIIGDGSITARVVSETYTAVWTKCGVMIRNSLAPGAANVFEAVTPSTTNGVAYQWRTTTGGSTSYTNFTGGSYLPPYWVRAVRSGTSFTVFCSPDGVTWTQQGAAQTISAANDTMQFGLAVASNNSSSLCTAVFDHITVVGTVNAAPTFATPAAASASTVTAPTVGLSALGADDAGESGLTYTWNQVGVPPAAVAFSANGTNAAKNTTVTFSSAGTYYFQLTITDAGGLTISSGIVQVTVNLLPPAPASLTATPGFDQVALSWPASSYATSYNVKRASASGGPYTTVGNLSANAYTDAGLTIGSTYYYVVTAANGVGESAASPVANATPLAPPAQAPAGVTIAVDSDQLSLAWNAATGASTYNVKRSLASGGPYTTLASVSGTSYVDAGLVNGTPYFYVISSANTGGESANSAEVSAAPAPQTRYWDTSTASGLLNGNGAWTTGATALWSNTSAGVSSPLRTWLNDDQAYFQTAGTSTVTIGSGVTILASSVNQALNGTATTVTGGTIQIDTDAGITNAVGGGNGTFTINSALVLNSPNVVVDNETTSANLVLGGVISGPGGAVSKGVGQLNLGTAVNTFSGGFTMSGGGEVQISANGSTVLGTGLITLNNPSFGGNGNLYWVNTAIGTLSNNFYIAPGSNNLIVQSSNGTATFTGAFTGSGTVQFQNGFSPAFNFNGDLTQFAGTFQLGSTNQVLTVGLTNPAAVGLANATLAITPTATGADILQWNPPTTTSATIPLGALSSVSTSTAAAPVLVRNAKSGTTATWKIGALGTNTTFGGVIQDGTGTSALTKEGAGVLTLSGANTYTGGTTLSGGTLNVTGSLIGAGAVVVNGGTLAGAGSIVGPTTVASGGVVSPGDAVTGAAGTLTLAGGCTLNGGSTLAFGLGSSSDKLALAGTSVAPAPGTVTVNISALAGFGAGTYALVTGASGLSASSFVIGTAPAGYTYTFSANGGVLSLSLTSPGAPTGLVATPGDGQVALTWNPSAGATGYTIRRSTTSGSGYTAVAGGAVAGTSFTDNSVTDGTTYYYVVTATNLAGTSANSTQASALPLSAAQSWRLKYFGTIANTGSAADLADPDGDGMNNADERTAGTDPTNSADVLKLQVISHDASGLTLSFNAKAGHSYVLQFNSDLVNSGWQTLETISAASTDTTITRTYSISPPGMFFRVVTPAP